MKMEPISSQGVRDWAKDSWVLYASHEGVRLWVSCAAEYKVEERLAGKPLVERYRGPSLGAAVGMFNSLRRCGVS